MALSIVNIKQCRYFVFEFSTDRILVHHFSSLRIIFILFYILQKTGLRDFKIDVYSLIYHKIFL